MDKVNRKYLVAFLVGVILATVIVVPITVTNAVVSNNRGKEILQNRVVWSLEISYERYNVNRTTLCGCNYTDSMLVINVSFSEWDNHSYYGLYIDDYWVQINPIYSDSPYEIILNSTSLINGREIYRDFFFNDWTKVYNVSLYEYFHSHYKVICWHHTIEFTEVTQIAIFSISNGFNWR